MSVGRVTSRGLTEHYLRRIDELDALLHAVIAISPVALAQADESDARRRAGRLLGALDGIPVLLKDNIDSTDQPTTAGSLALAGHRPLRDAHLVQQLRDAGAVLLGKTNLSEWANFRSTSSSSGWSAVGGQTSNPYVLGYNPSGSSSGSAVAVAAGLAVVSIGTETNGSIVSPAGSCGVVGVKPTLGLVSRRGVVPISPLQDTPGPLARTVADAALTLAMLAGVDPADAATGNAHLGLTRALDPDALAGARIGVWRSGLAGISPEVDACFDNAVATLRSLGAHLVDPADLPDLDDVDEQSWSALQHEFKVALGDYLSGTAEQYPSTLADVIAFNNAHRELELPHFGQETFLAAEATAGDLAEAGYLRARQQATRTAQQAIDDVLREHDLAAIIAPTNAPATRIDHEHGNQPGGIGSSTPAAVAGYPMVTVPMGSERDLPMGLSFIGGRWCDAELLNFAYAYEQATHARRAPRFLTRP